MTVQQLNRSVRCTVRATLDQPVRLFWGRTHKDLEALSVPDSNGSADPGRIARLVLPFSHRRWESGAGSSELIGEVQRCVPKDNSLAPAPSSKLSAHPTTLPVTPRGYRLFAMPFFQAERLPGT